MDAIGMKIRKVRKLRDFSQEYMAKQLNITQKAYSKIEFGETKVDKHRLVKISEILDVSETDLQSFDENYIFNNCNQSGKFDSFINQLPEKLMEQYEERIKQLEDEVVFLRNLVNK